jgi:hypothetical protein
MVGDILTVTIKNMHSVNDEDNGNANFDDVKAADVPDLLVEDDLQVGIVDCIENLI